MCALLILVSVLLVGGDPMKTTPSREPTAGVLVRVVRAGENSPDGTFSLFMEIDGAFTDLDFHQIKDGDLPAVLRASMKGGKQRYIKLVLVKEEKTSLETLGRALAKLRNASDPKVETTIIVHLGSFGK
jgi:hypothetical protein